MLVRITFTNGYAGCDESVVMEVRDMEEAQEYASERLYDYGQDYEHVAMGYTWDEGWEDDYSEEEYYEGCDFEIVEITEEEYENEKR